MERLTYIDSLKGIGIILVVVGHMFTPYKMYLDDSFHQLIYSFHMPLFFFLSGLVYVYSRKKPLYLFFSKKFLSLILPYLCFSGLYCFLKNVSWASLLIGSETHYGYWFTLTLFFVLVLNRLMDGLLVNRWYNWGGQFLITLLLLCIAKIEIVPEPIHTIISFDKIAKFYLFFQSGKYTMQSSFIRRIIEHNTVLTLLLCVYVFVFYQYGFLIDSVNLYSFILGICGVGVLYNIVKKNETLFSTYGILPFLGKKSLEIYLTHFLFLGILRSDIVSGYGVAYLQIFLLLLMSAIIICTSLIVQYIISCSDILSLLLYGKGRYFEMLIKKIGTYS